MKLTVYKNIFMLSIRCALITIFVSAGAQTANGEIARVGTLAPEWVVSEWMNSSPLTLKELKGKVVIVDFFQLWCPGCNSFSIPLMLKWEEAYKNNPAIQLLGIHTVFEGHDYQTPERLRNYIKEKKISHPVAVDHYVRDIRIPETMILYQTRGTPEMVIIDKKGVIRFKQFGSFDIYKAERLIEQLLKE